MGRSRGQKARKSRKASRNESLRGRFGSMLAGFLFGRPVDENTSDRLQEIKGLALIGISLWLSLSMATYYTPWADPQAVGHNWGGQAGFYLANAAFISVGLAGYLVAALGFAWGFVICARKAVVWPSLRIFGALCCVLSGAFLLQLAFGPDPAAAPDLEPLRVGASLPYGPGGWFAARTTPLLVEKFGGPGLWILLSLSLVLSFMLATEMAFYPAVAAFFEWLRGRREGRGEGLGAALWGWSRRLLSGLWEFLRGADLALATSASSSAARSERKASKAARVAAASGQQPELGEDEEQYEDDDEPEDDEYEYEYEYVDEDEDEDDEEGDYEEEEVDEDDGSVLVPAAKVKTPKAAKTAKAAKAKAMAIAKAGSKELTPSLPYEPPTPPPGPWSFPPLDILEPPEGRGSVDEGFLGDSAKKLEYALQSFRVEAEVVAAQVGPAVTLFELTVAQGTRMNKVTALSQEIAAALKARSVRIIAPIPGKSTIGIEVPNTKRRVVRLSELISQEAYDKKFMALPIFLGMDAEGNAIVEDLAHMPHLLIAGTTGSGKSVCINTILSSLLLTRSPHDVKMILVDPKMVELQMYATVPHLLLPVVTDMRQATNVLMWAVEKMEGRYELFKAVGVRNIKSFNGLGEEKLRERMGDAFSEERTPRHLPYFVLVIDEMADLMLNSKKEAEQTITRLAQKSRAVGIHVIVATQRPSTDVITGVLKGNLPTRIAFQVASKIDSRVILDVSGAEKLLGGGDMLYTPPQSSQVKRLQGALVEDHEIQDLVNFVCQEALPSFSQELIQSATGTSTATDPGGAQEDELWDDAVRVILKSRRGSASLLQRALGVGYTRASRLIDLMTDAGIVGEHKGSKAREVLMSLEDWEEMHGAPMGQGVNDE